MRTSDLPLVHSRLNEFVETVTEFRDGHGVLVAEARSTAIETARAPEEA